MVRCVGCVVVFVVVWCVVVRCSLFVVRCLCLCVGLPYCVVICLLTVS